MTSDDLANRPAATVVVTPVSTQALAETVAVSQSVESANARSRTENVSGAVATDVAPARPPARSTPTARESQPVSVQSSGVVSRGLILIEPAGPCDVYGRLGDAYRRAYRGLESTPVWGPDGRWIIFGGGPSGLYGPSLYLATTDATELRRIVREPDVSYVGSSRYLLERITYVDLSEDGTRLLYATCKTLSPESGTVGYVSGRDLYEISLVRLDEGTHTRLGQGNFPVWSPDGTRIAFVAQGSVHTMAADGTDMQRVAAPLAAPGRGSAEFPPRWSPDGTRLAFAVTERDGYAIYTVSADGTGLRRLSDAASNPSWSPDGERLAFIKFEPRGSEIYTVAQDGTDARRIASAGFFGSADRYKTNVFAHWIPVLEWSPDGSRIMYSCERHVCVVELPGRILRTEMRSSVGGFGGSPRLARAWSPDGMRIAIYNGARPRSTVGNHPYTDSVVLSIEAVSDGQRAWVVVRDRDGFVAERAQHARTGPVATRDACRAGLVVPAPASNPGLVRDCEVLVGLREELFGWVATNWTSNVPLDEWIGVGVTGAPGRVTKLELPVVAPFEHGGRLPLAMVEFEHLRRLKLSGNGLAGSIPAKWGAFARLWTLELAGNALTGEIPPELGSLAELEVLNLGSNRLSGAIPPELGKFDNLRVLNVASNQLSGAIPPVLGQLTRLSELSLNDNQLTGTIPPDLGQLENLANVDLAGNNLTGPIPTELGQLAALQRLVLASNQLTGAIPPSLGQLADLETLILSDNALTGPIPPQLGQLKWLRQLLLDGNELTGAIPADLWDLPRLNSLYLGGNRLKGCVPADFRVNGYDDFIAIVLPQCETAR